LSPIRSGSQELILVCLTNLFTRYPPMPRKLNHKWAWFVLSKIDEILAWKKQNEAERDTRFVDLGRYLSEVQEGHHRADTRCSGFRACARTLLTASTRSQRESSSSSL
jgi:hypothetical protein